MHTMDLLAALAIAYGIYLRGWWRMRVRGRAPRLALPSWRPVAFAGGLATVWLAMASPLAAWHERLLLMHMVQHLLLSALAAPLILIGAPSMPILYGLPRSLAKVLRTRSARACCHLLADPLVCWSASVLVFVAWHVPALFQIARGSHGWHLVEQASFLVSGLMFWWPVVQPWPSTPRWPRWSIPVYLFFATLPCDAISAFLAFSDRVVYPAYLAAPRPPGGWSALQDQEVAGAVMWLVVTLVYTVPAAAIAATQLGPRNFARTNSRDNWYFSQ
jgi:cytochrome c oxidase assembly factor CtaG